MEERRKESGLKKLIMFVAFSLAGIAAGYGIGNRVAENAAYQKTQAVKEISLDDYKWLGMAGGGLAGLAALCVYRKFSKEDKDYLKR